MKVVLINPPDDFLENSGDRPCLGLAYLAGYAQDYGFNDIQIVDMNHDSEIPSADIYGITATTPSYASALKIAKELKKKYHKPLILGGAHASAVP